MTTLKTAVLQTSLQAALIPVVASATLTEGEKRSDDPKYVCASQATFLHSAYISISHFHTAFSTTCEGSRILESGKKVSLWNPQGFFVVGVWNTTQGVRNPTNGAIWFPSSTDKESEIH